MPEATVRWRARIKSGAARNILPPFELREARVILGGDTFEVSEVGQLPVSACAVPAATRLGACRGRGDFQASLRDAFRS